MISKLRILIQYFTFIIFFSFTIPYFFNALAVSDPLATANNKFGIHLITATPDEASPAAQLANSSGGDWGYITITLEGKDKNKDKWQQFFNDLRKRHLIPIIRLATIPDGNALILGGQPFWKRPDLGEAQVWADFLDSLNWPVKNRYVVIYNEPNHGTEWGGQVDPKSYAAVLDQTITALKNKSKDFFVLNAGFDASSPNQLPNYEDEANFLQQMNEAVPGIFDKLDGWVSHSYPNPGFAGLPNQIGRGTIGNWYWEIQQLRSLGVTKNFPVFITETGWKHAEGLNFASGLPDQDTVAKYYQEAFLDNWSSSRVVAVTPFLLSYLQSPFDHFSFKKPEGDFYAMYQAIQSLPKTAGLPLQTNSAKLTKGEVYSSIVAGESYNISLTFKNTGQSIWNDREPVKLAPLIGGSELGIEPQLLPQGIKVEPGSEYTFNIQFKAPEKGIFKVSLNLFQGNTQFESAPIEFTTEVKLPVILQVLSALKWKKVPSGEYTLGVSGVIGDSAQKISLDENGKSAEIEARYLLPDYSFDFTLEKPYYHPVTIHQTVKPGVNTLQFGTLEPELLPALLHPKQLWQLLPFSN